MVTRHLTRPLQPTSTAATRVPSALLFLGGLLRLSGKVLGALCSRARIATI